MIKLINFFRSEAQAGRSPLAALEGGARPWDADTYLQPVLADDEMLFHDWEEEEDGEASALLGGHQAASRWGAACACTACKHKQRAAGCTCWRQPCSHKKYFL